MRKVLQLLLILPLLISAFAGLSGQYQPLPSSVPVSATSSFVVDHPTPEEFESGFPLPLRLAESAFDLTRHSEAARKIDTILNRRITRRGFWGVDIFSVDDGQFIYSRNSDKPLTPASNAKIFTTAAALSVLGADYRFKTRVSYEGVLTSDGRLSGHIVLFGQGDPDLSGAIADTGDSYHFLDQMARHVKQAGIQVVEGDVVGDDSYFAYLPYGKGWLVSDSDSYFGARVSALSFKDNVVFLGTRPTKPGRPLFTYLDPPNPSVKIVNQSSTTAPGHRSTVRFSPFLEDSRVVVHGRLPLNSRGAGRLLPMSDPALFTAQLFKDRLEQQGIKILGDARSRHSGESPWQDKPHELYTHESVPLKEIARVINKTSQNLYAEILLRTMGAEIKGEGVDWAGHEVVARVLRKHGVPPSMVRLFDGSGLSRMNLITPRAETTLLANLTRDSAFDDFRETLAISGKDGTLKHRMRGTAAAGRVYAKTGTLKNAVSLGGYVESRSGKLFTFTIIVNDHRFGHSHARKVADSICDILARM